MEGFRWSWLATPYVACAVAIAAVGLAGALVRGDRVLRIGMIGAAVTALPWALCQSLVACTDDRELATRLERLGNGPVELVGPCLLLVLLAASGQLERFRWVARLSGVIGAALLVIVWGTTWIVPGVQRLASGMYYVAPGPLTMVHIFQLFVWLAIGVAIMRVSSPRGERRRTLQFVIGILVLGSIGSIDVLVLYGVWGSYPLAWLPTASAAVVAVYLALRTDLLRPRGVDREVAVELAVFGASAIATGALALIYVESPLALAASGSVIWAALTAVAWSLNRRRQVRIPGARSLEQFVARVAALDATRPIAEQLAALWQRTLKIPVRHVWIAVGGELSDAATQARRALAPELAAWFVQHAQPLAVSDLATMRLGAMRAPLERLGADHPAALIVPLVDRGELVGLVEADRDTALRDAERELVAESALAAARAVTFAELARAAARERETAREVEVADALRLQASASRDAELGRWAVAAEYRTAPRTTGAGWSAVELADGRLALLVTEAQAHGVAAALATAALTGAFAAATVPGESALAFDELLATMRASSDGVLRGGLPVAAFLAILDARGGSAGSIEWACAGHPGAFLVGPIYGAAKGVRPTVVALGGELPAPGTTLTDALRGVATLNEDTLLIVASSALRGDGGAAWLDTLRDTASARGRLASVLVEQRLRDGAPSEDLLAVVVRG